MEKIRKVCTVLIHNNEYDVWDIEGKEHGGWNGEPKTWWIYYADRLPEGTHPGIDSENWCPYNVGINRHLWEVKFKQMNTSKEKWGSTQFSNHTSVEMYCNNKLIYSFGTTGNRDGLAFAMAKVQYLQVALSEHPFNFLEPEKENGREIWWHGLPATIVVSTHSPWEIKIKPEYDKIPKDKWWKEYRYRKTNIIETDTEWAEMEKEDDEEDEQSDIINWGDAYSDQYIGWFRQQDETVNQ